MSDTDIMLLFTRDPLQHTDADIDAIIKKCREQRHMFNSRPTPAPKASKAVKSSTAIDLGSLDLGDL